MARRPSAALTDGEARVMAVLWRLKTAESVAEVVTSLKAQYTLTYSTVQTTLRILEHKGYVAHEKVARAFVFRADRGPTAGPPAGAEAPDRTAVQRLPEPARVQRARRRGHRPGRSRAAEEDDRAGLRRSDGHSPRTGSCRASWWRRPRDRAARAAGGTGSRAGAEVWWTWLPFVPSLCRSDLVSRRRFGPGRRGPAVAPESSAPLVVLPPCPSGTRRRWPRPCGSRWTCLQSRAALSLTFAALRAGPARLPPVSRARCEPRSAPRPAHGWRSRGARVLYPRDVRAAAVLGVAAPIIARQPGPAPHLTDSELEQVVIHEWAHVARRDALRHVAFSKPCTSGRLASGRLVSRWAGCAWSARWRATKWLSRPADRPRRMRRA